MRRFLGDASHELRTPLTSVKGYAELYRSGATNDATMVMEKIEEEAARMSLLVEDLLSLTRSEEARFDEAPVDMLALGLSVVGSLRAAYPERSIEVDAKATDMPMVMGDTARLHQVLTNLIVNSLKHGGEEAKVRLSIDTDDNHVILEVSDDGVGVREADLLPGGHVPNPGNRWFRAGAGDRENHRGGPPGRHYRRQHHWSRNLVPHCAAKTGILAGAVVRFWALYYWALVTRTRRDSSWRARRAAHWRPHPSSPGRCHSCR